MRSATSPLSLATPRTLHDALSLLSDEPLIPIAGATDLYVQLNAGAPAPNLVVSGPGDPIRRPRRYMDISRLQELRGIAIRDNHVLVGACTTFTAIMNSAIVRERLPMLIQAASQIGGVQIQNRGTLGGNIANGSPAGDSLPALAAADAVLMLRSASAERMVPITSFYTGYRASVLRPDELIVAIDFPPVVGTQWFRKVGTRAAQALSKLVIAAVRSNVPSIAVGSVAATVMRLSRTERALAAGATIDEASNVLAEEITPIDDLRSTADYRRQVAVNLLRRFWIDTA